MGKIHIGPKNSEHLETPEVISPALIVEEPSIFQPEVEIVKEIMEVHHHHETKIDYDPSPIIEKLNADKKELEEKMVSIQTVLNNEIVKKEALSTQLQIQKERSDELRAMIQDLDVKLQLHEPRITEVEQRKVTEIVRVQERTPKFLYYLTIFNFILALIGFLT